MNIKLTFMNEQDFENFIEIATVNYAMEKIKNESWKEEIALEQSKADFKSLLPGGEKTEHNILKNIVLEGQNMGYIWYSINLKQEPFHAYLFEIFISSEARGKGLGTEAMKICIKEIKERGIDNLMLHVFGHNQGALKFYQQLGFIITDYHLTVDTASFK